MPVEFSGSFHKQSQAAELLTEALTVLGIPVSSEAPAHWVKAFAEMTSGCQDNPAEILSPQSEQSAPNELVILTDLSFASLCHQHLLPFSGVIHIGYLPGKTVDLSQLARLADCFAHRLQSQECLTNDIALAIRSHLSSDAVGVIIEASHFCLSCHGVKKHGATAITSVFLGKLRAESALRTQFLTLIRRNDR